MGSRRSLQGFLKQLYTGLVKEDYWDLVSKASTLIGLVSVYKFICPRDPNDDARKDVSESGCFAFVAFKCLELVWFACGYGFPGSRYFGTQNLNIQSQHIQSLSYVCRAQIEAVPGSHCRASAEWFLG